MYMYCVLYFSFPKNKDRYLNCPIFQQCLWHVRSSTLLNFLSMFVKYQDNLIIPFSDNVRDISGQLPCQIFWICVWHVRKTVSLYHPFFRQCLWHIRPITLSKVATEKKRGGGRKEKMTVVRVTTTTLPVDSLTATDCNVATDAFFLTIGVTYHKNCITSNKSSGNVDCVHIIAKLSSSWQPDTFTSNLLNLLGSVMEL